MLAFLLAARRYLEILKDSLFLMTLRVDETKTPSRRSDSSSHPRKVKAPIQKLVGSCRHPWLTVGKPRPTLTWKNLSRNGLISPRVALARICRACRGLMMVRQIALFLCGSFLPNGPLGNGWERRGEGGVFLFEANESSNGKSIRL